MANEHEVELGDEVEDRVSGTKGITIAKTFWLNGCIRWLVQGTGLHEGKPIDITVDAVQLRVMTKRKIVPRFSAPDTAAPEIPAPSARTGGGGRPDPVQPTISR